ncbi:MAG TPA: hypothetical protein PKD09_23435 [Aggregatilinea sp.]|nr:hypothetical protein [Aggregatilinea sp.]
MTVGLIRILARFPALETCDIPIYGLISDVKSGKLLEMPEATVIGAAS